MLIVWGQQYNAGGLAAILNASTPIFTVLVAHVFSKDEKISVNKIAGVLLGFSGVVVIIGPDLIKDLGLAVFGQLAVLGAAFSYAISAVFGKRFSSTKPMITATGQLICSTALMVPVVLISGDVFLKGCPGVSTWISILLLASVCTAAAFIIFFYIMSKAGATNVALVTLLIPVSAMLLGAIFLDETIGILQLGGLCLIILALASVDGRIFSVIRKNKK